MNTFDLSPAAYEAITDAMEHAVPCRNDKPPGTWTCQSYVTEVLDMLEDEWWLDADDDDYVRARRQLKALKGPISSVSATLLARPSKATDPSEESGGSGDQMNIEPKTVRFAKAPEGTDDG